MKIKNRKHNYISVMNTFNGQVYGTIDGSGYLLRVDNLNKLVSPTVYTVFVNLETGILVSRNRDDQVIDFGFSEINLA